MIFFCKSFSVWRCLVTLTDSPHWLPSQSPLATPCTSSTRCTRSVTRWLSDSTCTKWRPSMTPIWCDFFPLPGVVLSLLIAAEIRNISLLFSNQNEYRICPNKRPGRLIFRDKKKFSKPHRFHVLPPLKNHPSKLIGFVYSPLWKIIRQKPSVLCTPPFEKSRFVVGAYIGVGVYFDKYGNTTNVN